MKAFKQVYQVKIELRNVSPSVWRRIQVPEVYSFWDLHVAIQDAMGWNDSHLHEFKVQNPKTTTREGIGIPDNEGHGDPVLAGWEQPIAEYFTSDNPTALYIYDFGDDWAHTITFEGVSPKEAGTKYPCCLEGEQACPPDDIGGPPGYENFLEAIRDPKHEEHETMLEWIGGSFDPDIFEPKAIRFDDPKKRIANVLQNI